MSYKKPQMCFQVGESRAAAAAHEQARLAKDSSYEKGTIEIFNGLVQQFRQNDVPQQRMIVNDLKDKPLTDILPKVLESLKGGTTPVDNAIEKLPTLLKPVQ